MAAALGSQRFASRWPPWDGGVPGATIAFGRVGGGMEGRVCA